jgi:hypothetical protein
MVIDWHSKNIIICICVLLLLVCVQISCTWMQIDYKRDAIDPECLKELNFLRRHVTSVLRLTSFDTTRLSIVDDVTSRDGFLRGNVLCRMPSEHESLGVGGRPGRPVWVCIGCAVTEGGVTQKSAWRRKPRHCHYAQCLKCQDGQGCLRASDVTIWMRYHRSACMDESVQCEQIQAEPQLDLVAPCLIFPTVVTWATSAVNQLGGMSVQGLGSYTAASGDHIEVCGLLNSCMSC